MTADARRGERVQPTVDRPATVVDQDLGVGVQIDVDGKKQYRYDSLAAMLEPGARRELYIAPEPNLPTDFRLLYGADMRSANGSEYHVVFDHKGPVTPGLTSRPSGARPTPRPRRSSTRVQARYHRRVRHRPCTIRSPARGTGRTPRPVAILPDTVDS
ncbi:hypothetical protein [Saccharopolyspora shandongensis]|uniref:hypothetical protein n=1 Tax=Saccharopolyspora shandongensis TaxID=418495 RepID=UPI0033C51F90